MEKNWCLVPTPLTLKRLAPKRMSEIGLASVLVTDPRLENRINWWTMSLDLPH